MTDTALDQLAAPTPLKRLRGNDGARLADMLAELAKLIAGSGARVLAAMG